MARRLPIRVTPLLTMAATDTCNKERREMTELTGQTFTAHATQPAYKLVVEQIKQLDWGVLNSADLTKVWYLSWVAAVEFAEALRIALELYPHHRGLTLMARGELKTRNLRLDDYVEAGDHHEFLEHFLRKHGVFGQIDGAMVEHGVRYLDACRK